MALVKAHGRAAEVGEGTHRIEVLRPERLPEGVPGPQRDDGAVRRDANGRLADRESARALGARGGAAKAGQVRLSNRLALGDRFAVPEFEAYAKAAVAFRRAQVAQLAQQVGGGACGPGPSSMVASAALQLAASRFAFEVLGDMKLGSQLANDSRQNLLAAHELCAREARARKDRGRVDLGEVFR